MFRQVNTTFGHNHTTILHAKAIFRQVKTIFGHNRTTFDIITQSLDKSTPHLGIITLLLDKRRQRLGMSTLLLTTSDSCGVP